MAQVPNVWTVLSMLEWATEYFEEQKVNSPRLSIEWLLADVLSVKRLDLYLIYDKPLSSEEIELLRPMVKRRGVHEPLQYITGSTDFFGFPIKVKPGVLIPRPETEELVELILNDHESDQSLKVIDIGTGSGCIPIALKRKKESWNIYATDISDNALQQAKSNAELNEAEISFEKDDLFNPQIFNDQKFDILVSNPPYIHPDEKEGLDKEVREYEPGVALFCESTDKMFSAISRLADKYLNENGSVYLEIHYKYHEIVSSCFNQEKWSTEIINDVSGKPRFLVAKRT